MKKFISFLIIICLFLGIAEINATSGDKLYGIQVLINGNTENHNVHGQQHIMEDGKITIDGEHYNIVNGAVTIDGIDISLNYIKNGNYVSLENYDSDTNNVNITLNGDSIIEAFGGSGYSGTYSISGSGSLKFKPISGIGTIEVPNLISGGVPVYYINDISSQQSWVSLRIITSLPVTYVDGYVCINCKSKPVIEEQPVTSNSNDNNTTNNNVNDNTNSNLENNTNQNENLDDDKDKINEEKTKKLISDNGFEFISNDEIDNKNKLIVNDVTDKYKDMDLSSIITENQQLLYVYDISIFDENNSLIEMKDGKYTIKIKLTDELKKFNKLIVGYLNNNEIKERFNTIFQDEYLVFETTHLSEYAIIGVKESNESIIDNVNPNDKIDNKHNNIYLYIIIGGAIIVGISILVFIFYKNKMKNKQKNL